MPAILRASLRSRPWDKLFMVGLFIAIPAVWAMSRPVFGVEALEPGFPADGVSAYAKKILDLTNVERKKVGAPPLVLNGNLCGAAQWLAADMASNGYFDHLDRLGRRVGARVYDSGYRAWKLVGENIAAGQNDPEKVIADWMSSACHRKNLLNPAFTELGVGYATNDKSVYGNYWVQTLGTRPTFLTAKNRVSPTSSISNPRGTLCKSPFPREVAFEQETFSSKPSFGSQ